MKSNKSDSNNSLAADNNFWDDLKVTPERKLKFESESFYSKQET